MRSARAQEGIAVLGQVRFLADLLVGQRDVFLVHTRRLPLGDCAPEIGGALVRRGIDMLQDRHGDGAVVPPHGYAAHALRIAALEDAHIAHRKTDAFAQLGGEQEVVLDEWWWLHG